MNANSDENPDGNKILETTKNTADSLEKKNTPSPSMYYAEKLRHSESERIKLEEKLDEKNGELIKIAYLHSQENEKHIKELTFIKGFLESELQTKVSSIQKELSTAQHFFSQTWTHLSTVLSQLTISNTKTQREISGFNGTFETISKQLSTLITMQGISEQNSKSEHDLQNKLENIENDYYVLQKKLQESITNNSSLIVGLTQRVSELQQENYNYKTAVTAAQDTANKIQRTVAFQLGNILINSTKSWNNILTLPYSLFKLYHERKVKKNNAKYRHILPESLLTTVEKIYKLEGLTASEQYIVNKVSKNSDLANAYTLLSRLVFLNDPEECVRLAYKAVNYDPKPFRQKWLGFTLFKAGKITQSAILLFPLSNNKDIKPSESDKINYISGCYRILANSIMIPERTKQSLILAPNKKSILYVAASAQPYHISGYTIRTHNIIKSLKKLGYEISCVTRPGYPDDRLDAVLKRAKNTEIIDGVCYKSLLGPHRNQMGPDEYIKQSAEIIIEEAKVIKPSIIHAASNYENALPALIAARRLGIPFIYEVRGLWEYSTASKIPKWENTEVFMMMNKLEILTAVEADYVFTLTQGLAGKFIEGGVSRDKIGLTPNAIDPDTFIPREKDINLLTELGLPNQGFIIGYIGSIVSYEGLDDLISALKKVLLSIPNVYVVIIGNGNALPALQTQVSTLALEKHVLFLKQLKPTEVFRYFSIFDAVVLPRKPYTVCQLVSPLKPFEAMAMRIPLIVSDVLALKEIIKDGINGLVFPAGNYELLAERIVALAMNRKGGEELANRAYQDVLQHHTWDKIVQTISTTYDNIVK